MWHSAVYIFILGCHTVIWRGSAATRHTEEQEAQGGKEDF